MKNRHKQAKFKCRMFIILMTRFLTKIGQRSEIFDQNQPNSRPKSSEIRICLKHITTNPKTMGEIKML